MTRAVLLSRRSVLLGAAGTAALPAAALAPRPAPTGTRPVNTLGSSEAVAIRGYDPVAYFREGAPREGLAEHSAIHGEAIWRFAGVGNKALFEADSRRYLPAYGSFCAYGTSRGYLVKIEPEAWSIIDGRLFLNYDLGTRETWSADRATYIARADERWPALSDRDIR